MAQEKGHKERDQALQWTDTGDKLSGATSHQGWVTHLGQRTWVWQAQPHL